MWTQPLNGKTRDKINVASKGEIEAAAKKAQSWPEGKTIRSPRWIVGIATSLVREKGRNLDRFAGKSLSYLS